MSRPKIVIKSKAENTPTPPQDNKPAEPIQQPEPSDTSIEQPVIVDTEQTVKSNNFPWIPLISLILVGILIIGGSIYYFFFFNQDNTDLIAEENVPMTEESISTESSKSNDQYAAKYDDFEKDILGDQTTMNLLLNDLGIANSDIINLTNQAKKSNIHTLRKGDKFSTYFNNETPGLIILEPKNTPTLKYEIDLENIEIRSIFKKKELRKIELAAIIETNLAVTFMKNNLNFELVDKIEEIFQYSFDLFRLDDGDRFKIIYEQEFLDGKPYHIKTILCAHIQEDKKDYYAFKIKQNNSSEYFNEFGQSLKRSFLSSPIKDGGLISSGFGLRIHPVEKHEKMHFGTDYAAPEGTPIVATADGRITIRNNTSKNGNYIKMRHDNTFETQYLHMQKFEDGVIVGSYVKQGDVIGYVGKTGNVTGPHVCYRFWKDKVQVDPFENITSGMNRIPSSKLSEYLQYIKPIKASLKKIDYL